MLQSTQSYHCHQQLCRGAWRWSTGPSVSGYLKKKEGDCLIKTTIFDRLAVPLDWIAREPRVLAAYRGSPRGAMRLTGIFRSIIRIGIIGNAEESHEPPSSWGRAGAKGALRNRNFLQSIRIAGWLVLCNHQKEFCRNGTPVTPAARMPQTRAGMPEAAWQLRAAPQRSASRLPCLPAARSGWTQRQPHVRTAP